MFNKNSRYAGQDTVTVTDDDRQVQAVKLRRLPKTQGKPYMVQDTDQLDVISKQRFQDGTRYWHIADANTELHANELLSETGRIINMPEK